MDNKVDIKIQIEQLRVTRSAIIELVQKLKTEKLSISQQVLEELIITLEKAKDGSSIRAMETAIAEAEKVITNINHVQKSIDSLQEKQQEAQTLLAQANQKMKGFLTDVQKAKLSTAINKLNKIYKSSDIAAIEDAIAGVKAAMPPPPKGCSKRFLWILLLGVIVAIAMNFNNIMPFIQSIIKNNSQTYTTHHFSIFGNAQSYNSYIGNIDSKSGFRFTVNSDSKTTAKLSLKYQCDKRGGILKVNDEVQNLYFPAINGNWGTKEVIAQLEQGTNTIEFGGGWLTDYAPDIAEIKVLRDNSIKKDDIVGVWKGTYTENGTNGIGNVILTVNDDKTGVIKTTISKRKPHQQLIKAYYTVSVTGSNGVYNVSGKEWIVQPDEYGFDTFEGTVSNSIFKGANFTLEKINSKMANTNEVFPFKGSWELTGKDSYNNWIADLIIDEKKGNNFSGYFEWYRSGNYAGKEYYRGEYNPQNRTVVLKGYKLSNSKNLDLGTYRASFNGNNFDSGTWGGANATSGTWNAYFSVYSTKTEKNADTSVEQVERNGVIINGVKWATRNVDKPGTFAKNPESIGWYYQWNKKVGWSPTDPLKNSNGSTTWDKSISSATNWEKVNDPSPKGWHIPTSTEINSLLPDKI